MSARLRPSYVHNDDSDTSCCKMRHFTKAVCGICLHFLHSGLIMLPPSLLDCSPTMWHMHQSHGHECLLGRSGLWGWWWWWCEGPGSWPKPGPCLCVRRPASGLCVGVPVSDVAAPWFALALSPLWTSVASDLTCLKFRKWRKPGALAPRWEWIYSNTCWCCDVIQLQPCTDAIHRHRQHGWWETTMITLVLSCSGSN